MKRPAPRRKTETAIQNDQRSRFGIESVISLDVEGYPSGKDSIIWGTYDLRQAETIMNALVAQQIGCIVVKKSIRRKGFYLLLVNDGREAGDAMDFIWRERGGLRLKPDWNYEAGEGNKSFEQWLSG